MKLSKKERLFLSNQLKILESLYPESADAYKKHRTALEEGYELNYDWMVDHITDEVLSKEGCREVFDILEMFSMLKVSYERLEDKSGIDKSDIEFLGFDGNNEGSQFSYTLYLIEDLNRFKELKEGRPDFDFNSHMPMLPDYRKMLNMWNQCDVKHKLSKEEIKKIISV